MAFVGSFNSRIVVGALSFSTYVRGFSPTMDRAMLDVTTIADTAKQFIPGQLSASVTIDALLDGSGAAGSEFITLNTWSTTPQAMTIAPRGLTAGTEVMMFLGNQSNATLNSEIAGVASASISVDVDGNPDVGVVISNFTAITTDTNGASVDNGAATSNGGVAHLHLTDFSGLTSNSVIVEHSTNDSVWATLGTFTTATGTTWERLVIAPGTTVNRYLRIRDDVTGTGTCTRMVAFARR